MASNIKRMDEIRNILKFYNGSRSIKATAKHLGISKNTVRRYLRQCLSHGISLTKIDQLKDAELYKVFYGQEKNEEVNRQAVFATKTTYWIQELKKVGVTRQLLWEEYKADYPKGYSYSQFCDHLRRYIKGKDLTLAMDHPPGKQLMLDFAGKKMPYIDPISGQECYAEVLVGVLPHSHYTFVIALANQSTESFLYGLRKTLEYIGGTPEYILSDNLKAYVTRADRYEPKFNELTVQLANHYGVHLQSTRVGKPKDKGSVENMVSTVYTRLYAKLRHKTFYSINELNEAFIKQLKEHNTTPFQKREGSRQLVYDRVEKPKLKPLPCDPFEIKKVTGAKVQNNYHVFIGEEKNYYSVPYQYVGQSTEVVYTSRMVEVYLKGKRIALHSRLQGEQKYQYSTQESHKPEAHKVYEKLSQYKDEDFIEQASHIGENTHWAIQHTITHQANIEQAYASCLGILKLGKKVGHYRLEKACIKCKQVNRVTYRMLKNILDKNIEECDLATGPAPKIQHQNLRGSQAYY